MGPGNLSAIKISSDIPVVPTEALNTDHSMDNSTLQIKKSQPIKSGNITL